MSDLVIVFPGQGSQYTGMGKTWFDANDSVRDRFHEASDCREYGDKPSGFPLKFVR